MARRSLRPHLNQIRTWVRQGRTDAWIAHQLEVTVQQISSFKREQGLEEGDVETTNGADFDDEIDLRAEDEALVAAELDAAEAAAPRRPRPLPRPVTTTTAMPPTRTPTTSPSAAAGAAAGAAAPPAAATGRSRARSTTARRATGCGSTRPSPTTPCTRSTGPATGPSRSRSRRTRS
jgi:hypothetical protein